MATKPASPDLLTGFDAILAGQPMAQTPRGGMESGFYGETAGSNSPRNTQGAATDPNAPAPQNQQQRNPLAGQGPLLEDDDQDVFQQVHGLVLRQELVAMNRLAQDTHWCYVVTGYPWSTLTKEPGRDTYKQTLPYGTAGIQTQAVPNKAWDLLNKTAETLLVDFPESDAEPMDDSEESESACDLANRFLSQDASEQGTNDAQLFHDRVMRALFTASSFVECWTDPTGGGYVPLQIKAHPQAQDPQNPLVGPDGMPTTDYVLRYVTDLPENGGQFTDDPAQATPQWLPKLRAARWNREHIRVYPEHVRVEDAEKVIILGYCTLGEARRRWSTVAQMDDKALSKLTDWTPTRYLPLLPPFQRARWKLTDGREKERQGSSDERLMFYYHIYVKACPDYPKGADVVVSGINGGLVIDRKLLAKPVQVRKSGESGAGVTTEVRCLEIPVVQITPVDDPFDLDPMGRSFLELFAGAVENNAHLAMSFSQLVDNIIHTPWVVPATSPIDGDDIKNARATGDMIPITTPQDEPKALTPPPVPTAFFNVFELADDAINSMASQNRPAQGSDKQQEVSGRAREIAVQQNNLSNTSKQNVIGAAYSRWCRIKLERAMADFETPQQVSYIGEDGASKQDEWTGVDFALVGKVTIKAGTGTMMTPDQKVQYIGNLQSAGLLPADEAADAARPAFAKRLGLTANPHEQFIERCIETWLDGPPSPEWIQQYQQWQQAQAQFQQQQAAYQQQAALFQQAEQMRAIASGGPPNPTLGPEQQNAQAMDQYQAAVLWLQTNPAIPAMPPQPPQPPQIPEPWHPFKSRPNETEPAIAAMWTRKLSKVISSVKYDQFAPEWQDVLARKYGALRQAVAVASGATPGSPPQHTPVGVEAPQQPKQSPQFPGPKPPQNHQQQHPQTPTAARAA